MSLPEAKEFRLGVADGELRSLTFKVWRNGGDIYFACRELDAFKLSFHKSGVHRLATNSEGPRQPLERTRLLDLVPGRFNTVARLILTSHSQWNSRRGATPKTFLGVKPDPFTLYSFGFTPHHPFARLSTTSPEHVATIKISDTRFFTITKTEFGLTHFLNDMTDHHQPYVGTGLLRSVRGTPENPGYLDTLMHYRTRHHTYLFWAHHDVPQEQLQSVMAAHPIVQALQTQISEKKIQLHPSQPLDAPRPAPRDLSPNWPPKSGGQD